MTKDKRRRQRMIEDLIRSGGIANQEQLSLQLANAGFAVTQATISRDLEQVGALKVRNRGQVSYALPDQVGRSAAPDLAAVFRDWVRTIDDAGNLIVIKTPPGSAHLVGVALDETNLPNVVGTICGDDTVFIAFKSASQAGKFLAELHSLRTGPAH